MNDFQRFIKLNHCFLQAATMLSSDSVNTGFLQVHRNDMAFHHGYRHSSDAIARRAGICRQGQRRGHGEMPFPVGRRLQLGDVSSKCRSTSCA